MEIPFHHDKHLAAYVNNLNLALDRHPELAGKSLEGLLMDLDAIPEDIRTVVRNHGGGSCNHDLFWQVMTPKMGSEHQGELKKAITTTFGTFYNFKAEFEKTGMGRFGSGWVWLVKKGNGLVIF